MRKPHKTLPLLLLAAMLSTTLIIADAKKGHRIYKKKMQRSCKFAGSIFARKHTQDEWEKIKKENRFKEETQKICPELNTGKLKEKQWKDLYDFSYKFAVGGEIPNGCDPK